MSSLASLAGSLNFKRRLSQVFFFTLFCSVSLFGIFRFDLPAMTMYLADHQISISDVIFLYMFWGMMVPLLLFTYAFLGRGICGWACPQTIMSEFANKTIFAITGKREVALKKSEHVHTRDKIENVMLMSADEMLKNIQSGNPPKTTENKRSFSERYLYTLFAILLAVSVSALFAFSFVAYFAPTTLILSGLATLFAHAPVVPGGVSSAQWFIFVFVLMMLNLTFWRHSWCKTLCPYGIWQSLWRTKNALRVVFDNRHREDCVDCDMCRRTCFMEVEPRNNPETQFDCINCGKCIDSCTTVLGRKNKPSLLKFGFGWSPTNAEAETGIKKKVPVVIYALPVIFFVSLGNLGYSLMHYIPMAMSVSRDEHYVVNNKDLSEFNHFIVTVSNKSNEAKDYALSVHTAAVPDGKIIWADDPNAIHLKKGETRKIKFYVNVHTAKDITGRDNTVTVTIRDSKDAKHTLSDKAKMFTKS